MNNWRLLLVECLLDYLVVVGGVALLSCMLSQTWQINKVGANPTHRVYCDDSVSLLANVQ